MDYTKLAKEARKLYQAFSNEFGIDIALELTKLCVTEFPMFQDFVVEEYI
jgi:hypothetical protein